MQTLCGVPCAFAVNGEKADEAAADGDKADASGQFSGYTSGSHREVDNFASRLDRS